MTKYDFAVKVAFTEKGSRELDLGMARELGWTWHEGLNRWRNRDGIKVWIGEILPPFTTDLRSAKRLAKRQFGDLKFFVQSETSLYVASTLVCLPKPDSTTGEYLTFRSSHEEPALALCVAILLADKWNQRGKP